MNVSKSSWFVVLIFVGSWILSTGVSCQSKNHSFNIRREDSHVGFSIYKWLVIKEEGRFKDFEGTVVYDPENPSATSVEFSVKTASVDSRNQDRDGALRSKEFFHVEKYPLMTFKSVNATPGEDGRLVIEGDLTIRSTTKRMSIPVRVLGVHYAGRQIGSVAGFESTFILNREDFGVAMGWDVIGKEVTINLLIGANNSSLASMR